MPEVRSTLELDISDALASIETVRTELDSITATPVALVVDADTSEAQAAVAGVGDAATTAAGETSELNTEIVGMDAALGVAAGSAAGLTSELEGMGGTAGAVTGIVAAAAATLGVFFVEAVEAQGASQRMDAALGGFRGQVENINVGSLNADLSELALQLGGDDDALRQAATSFFQLGTSAGVARGEVARSTEQIIALSARAVALKPSLGDVGEVADGLSRALSRGGKFASQYNIDLTATEIALRASEDAGGKATDQLSFYEKAAAGAALATEKYGDSLDKVIAQGAQNSIITLARLKQTLSENIEALGMPLISPIFELLEELIPAATAVGGALSSLGQGVLPVVLVALNALSPVLQIVAEIMEALAPLVSATAGAFTALLIARPLLSFLSNVGAGLAATALQFRLAGNAASAATAQIAATRFALLSSGIGAVVAVIGLVAGAFGGMGDAAKAAGFDVQKLGRLGDESLTKLAEAVARVQADIARFSEEKGLEYTRQQLDSVRDAAEQNIGTATRLGEAFVAAGVITETQFNRVIREASAGQVQLANDNRAAAASLAALVDTAVGALPTLGSVLDTTKTQLDGFGQGLDSAATPEVFLANLQASIQGILNFQATIQELTNRGLTEVVEYFLKIGPVAGGAIAQGFLDGNPLVVGAIEANIAIEKQVAGVGYADFVTGLQVQIASGFGGIASDAALSGGNVGRAFADGLILTGSYAKQAGQEVARLAAFGLANGGSPTEHLFFDSGQSFARAAIAGFASASAPFGVQAGTFAASGANGANGAGSVAGIAPASVQVIVVRDGWEARQHLPAGTGQQVDTFLSGR